MVRSKVNHCTSKYLFISILISLLVQWLTESRFGKTKFGFPIEIRERASLSMASVCHALGRGAVRCRAVARLGRAVAVGVRWGGRGVCASGVGARCPALQGFSRWASRCALLLRGWSAGGAESLRAAWWGASTIVEAKRACAGLGVEGAGVKRVQRRRTSRWGWGYQNITIKISGTN